MAKVNSKTWLKLIIAAVLGLVAGYVIRAAAVKGPAGIEQAVKSAGETSPQAKQQKWTCSMHPQIIKDKPGKCPICGMELIPVSSPAGQPGAQAGKRQIVFSEDALKLMELQTSVVERKFVEAKIRMVGKVDYDETKVRHITAWVPGRIDRLYVDFTGTRVSRGDHMVYLYSPELLSAQAELLQAVKAVQNIGSGTSELMKRSTLATLDAAKEKLRLLGLQAKQIELIEQTGKPTEHVTIYAPIGGVVVEKYTTEGMYVNTGTKIYTVADLSKLWVKLDAYESDMMWVRYGQKVEFSTEAYPGEVFKGRISFIDPILDPKTRTVKLRVDVANSNGRLKPDMFVRAIVRSKVAAGGMVMDADMAGKWICPMHPSVVKSQAGKCDICGMDLVTTESLGYVKAEAAGRPPLVIPASAPLITGKRAVVYVKLPGGEKPTFEGRQVMLGPRAADYYLVTEGLKEGERVVTKGNFKIDSAMQIEARPSMMNPGGQGMPAGHKGHNQ